jgi:hypothetical protein
VFQFPLAVDTSGSVWFHEKNFTEDGGPRTASLVSSFANNPGKTIVVNGVRPDTDDLQGGYTITFNSINRSTRGKTTRTYPAISITSASGQKSVRVKGEQVGFTVSMTAAPSFWRQGALQMDILINSGSQ